MPERIERDARNVQPNNRAEQTLRRHASVHQSFDEVPRLQIERAHREVEGILEQHRVGSDVDQRRKSQELVMPEHRDLESAERRRRIGYIRQQPEGWQRAYCHRHSIPRPRPELQLDPPL